MTNSLSRRSPHGTECLDIGRINAESARPDDDKHLIACRQRDQQHAGSVPQPHQREEDRQKHDLWKRICIDFLLALKDEDS